MCLPISMMLLIQSEDVKLLLVSSHCVVCLVPLCYLFHALSILNSLWMVEAHLLWTGSIEVKLKQLPNNGLPKSKRSMLFLSPSPAKKLAELDRGSLPVAPKKALPMQLEPRSVRSCVKWSHVMQSRHDGVRLWFWYVCCSFTIQSEHISTKVYSVSVFIVVW